jgi:cellulose synthase/poly-beta-1,6-N-acetylglucosamine synthase-like glycosyltransferase
MEAKTLLPNEIVIVDGGSTDGTWEFLQAHQPKKAYSLNVFQEKGCNVARGRNLAIASAKYDIIVSTDIGCIWEPEWLEELIQPLLKNQQVEAVMGSWRVRWEDLKSDWAKVEFALLNQPQLIANPKSHASSRSIAYRRSLWEKIGGYPEDLTLAGDDMVFALLLHQHTSNVGYSPIPRCYWERPATLKSFCKESHRNFKGCGEAGIFLSYGILVGGRLFLEVLLLLGGLIWIIFMSPIWLGIILITCAIFSVGLRIIKLCHAIYQLQKQVYSKAFIQSIIFEYMTKFYSLLGYWEGFFFGSKNCRECRKRLRQSYQDQS